MPSRRCMGPEKRSSARLERASAGAFDSRCRGPSKSFLTGRTRGASTVGNPGGCAASPSVR
eukprot:4656184-Pleurochrysis_carterae.AAC.1